MKPEFEEWKRQTLGRKSHIILYPDGTSHNERIKTLIEALEKKSEQLKIAREALDFYKTLRFQTSKIPEQWADMGVKARKALAKIDAMEKGET